MIDPKFTYAVEILGVAEKAELDASNALGDPLPGADIGQPGEPFLKLRRLPDFQRM